MSYYLHNVYMFIVLLGLFMMFFVICAALVLTCSWLWRKSEVASVVIFAAVTVFGLAALYTFVVPEDSGQNSLSPRSYPNTNQDFIPNPRLVVGLLDGQTERQCRYVSNALRGERRIKLIDRLPGEECEHSAFWIYSPGR